MAEAVEDAFMGDDAVGESQLITGLVEGNGHRISFHGRCGARSNRTETACEANRPSQLAKPIDLVMTVSVQHYSGRSGTRCKARRCKMPGETTEVLAQFAASLPYDHIPARAREDCKDV